MRRISWLGASVLAGVGLVLGVSTMAACGGSDPSTFPDAPDGGADAKGDVVVIPPIGNDEGGPAHEAGVPCPPGLQCNVACPGGKTTTIRGKVYDPAGKNPLYNVAVYVPATALQPLPKGVPTGADACSCEALFKSGAVANTTTGVDGSFELTNVPVGANVPLVLQVGKWRRLVHVPMVTACTDNTQADKSLTLPGTVAAGDTDDNIPDIAVSTGNADTLECLMRRIGIPASEYVAGTGKSGHVHVFSGGSTAGGGIGKLERHAMTGAPPSHTDLWASQSQLMPYDILLLSCEGGETYDANPAALEQYLNAGGRAFASHFHYAWFSGPIATTQSYATNQDWGNSLATWSRDDNTDDGPIGGAVQTTLNAQSGNFAKGQALAKWLGVVNALGQNNVPADELSIYSPRYNASVGPTNKASQPWLTADPNARIAGSTMYFSFDTPVDAPAPADGGAPNYCGRAVFSDLHVAGDPVTNDTANDKTGSAPPDGCGDGDLSPQEKALEFMLFDLSSCVIPDTVAPPDGGPGIR